MLAAAGMPCAITNPLEEAVRESVLAIDALTGHDDKCAVWIRLHTSEMERETRRSERHLRRREKSLS